MQGIFGVIDIKNIDDVTSVLKNQVLVSQALPCFGGLNDQIDKRYLGFENLSD